MSILLGVGEAHGRGCAPQRQAGLDIVAKTRLGSCALPRLVWSSTLLCLRRMEHLLARWYHRLAQDHVPAGELLYCCSEDIPRSSLCERVGVLVPLSGSHFSFAT